MTYDAEKVFALRKARKQVRKLKKMLNKEVFLLISHAETKQAPTFATGTLVEAGVDLKICTKHGFDAVYSFISFSRPEVLMILDDKSNIIYQWPEIIRLPRSVDEFVELASALFGRVAAREIERKFNKNGR